MLLTGALLQTHHKAPTSWHSHLSGTDPALRLPAPTFPSMPLLPCLLNFRTKPLYLSFKNPIFFLSPIIALGVCSGRILIICKTGAQIISNTNAGLLPYFSRSERNFLQKYKGQVSIPRKGGCLIQKRFKYPWERAKKKLSFYVKRSLKVRFPLKVWIELQKQLKLINTCGIKMMWNKRDNCATEEWFFV